MNTFCLLISTALCGSADHNAQQLSPNVSIVAGPINRVVISNGSASVGVYGNDIEKVGALLLTSHRRDALAFVRETAVNNVNVIAPVAEQAHFIEPQQFWDSFTKARFHDYAQQTTKILAKPVAVTQWVNNDDKVNAGGIEFKMVATPGYTRGSVSYIATIDDTKYAFTGDLIYGDGQIIDLYSFQDAIAEANIRGYHGYGSRLAQLVKSLRIIAATKPDLIVPARGPVIRDPQESIAKLIDRVERLYRNYLSTNALHWYFKEERMRTCGARVLGKSADIELMPYSHHEKTPDWVFEQSTSRVLISDSGSGFLLDCGNQRVIDAVKTLMDQNIVKKIDGIFVTHFHDDHTDMVAAAAKEFACPVYATAEYADVLEHPEAYHLPAQTDNAIRPVTVKKDGEVMKWNEFTLTFHFFPGQTYYHGGLLVKRNDEKPIFFVGDAFAPSGIDDYCVLNRNLVHDDSGYLLCMKKLRAVTEPYWLVNEHIPFVFSFDDDEMTYLETRYRERIAVLRELFPWDDPNYGIDEQWAVFYPYGVTAIANEFVTLEVRLTNHSPVTRTFTVTPRVDNQLIAHAVGSSITLKSRERGAIAIAVQAPHNPGNYLVRADVKSAGMEFVDWVETLVTVE